MRKRLPTIILIVLFLIGLSLLLYPTLSDYWNSFHQTKAISSYSEIVADLDDETYERLWKEAQQYNKTLVGRGASYTLSKAEQKKYESLLNVTENGMMGYIEIQSFKPRLDTLPGPRCRWAARAHTVSCPDTGVCPRRVCLPTWIS